MPETPLATLEKPSNIYSESELFNKVPKSLITLKILYGKELNQVEKNQYNDALTKCCDEFIAEIGKSLEKIRNELAVLRQAKSNSEVETEKSNLRTRIIEISKTQDELYAREKALIAEFESLIIV